MKKRLISLLLIVCLVFASVAVLVACDKDPEPEKDTSGYTRYTYTSVSPSNWNELTYQDENDTQVMGYIGSGFFEYDFKFDANGEVKEGEFDIKMSAITKVEDITADFAGDEDYAVPEDAESGYAYAFTLRQDLKWDDGTPIKAEDFVYTMKQQLDPLFQNYRADSFYIGSTIIHNAMNYVKQGSTIDADCTRGVGVGAGEYTGWDNSAAGFGLSEELQKKLYFVTTGDSYVGAWAANWYGGPTLDAYVYLTANYATVPISADTFSAMNGKTLYELLNDAENAELYKTAIESSIEFWCTKPDEEFGFFCVKEQLPALDFDKVGMFVGDNEYELIVVLDKALEIFKPDGETLSYKAAYNFSGFPLVKKDLYESCKHEPRTGETLWTSTYNSSVETTASWGPYKLTYFQAGKEYRLERNPYWYGYTANLYPGQYQTDRIVCETIAEWNTAFLKFKKGELDSIGVDVSVAADYKGSERALFTGDEFVSSLQLQSSKEALAANQTDKTWKKDAADSEHSVNKTILSYKDFRKAISLSFNRAEYCRTCTTANQPGFGLFNAYHYYDVENGGAYRNTIPAKKTLCEAYAVEYTDANLEEKYASITGYDLDEARALVTKAYNEALEAGDITANDYVVFSISTSTFNEITNRQNNFIEASLQKMCEGTPLEGRIFLDPQESGTKWADDFRAGKYDMVFGGWSGAAWDPGYFLLAYLSPDYMYSRYWDTSAAKLALKLEVPEYVEGAEEEGGKYYIEDEMSLIDWYDVLNGNAGCAYDLSEANVDNEYRLPLIAALEKEVLSVYYSVPVANSYSASLVSYKCDYITDVENTFMGFGGIRYLHYNYTDNEWAKFVADQGGEIDYTK